MRANVKFIIVLGLFLSSFSTTYGKSIKVVIAGSQERIEAYSVDQITYFSLSGLADNLGGTLDWSVLGHSVSYIEGASRFEFMIGSPLFKLGDSLFNCVYPATLKKGQLYLPAETFLPFLDQVFAQKITWEPGSMTIRVSSEYFNVTDFSIEAKANGLLIEIFLSTAMAYDIYVTEGNWMNVSIRGARINRAAVISRRDQRYMYKLKVHQAETSGQISFRLKTNIERWHHKLIDDPPRIQISIADVDFSLDTADTNPVIGPDNIIDVVVIDPGHGGTDYGAIGRGGTREKDVALDIAKRLAKLIRKDKQFKVIMTRDKDKTMTLEERAKIANQASADLFISIHANSSLKRHVRGWNVFFLATAKNDSARAVAQLENSVYLREQSAFNAHRSEYDPEFEDPVLSIINEMIMTEFQTESHDFAVMCDRELRRNLKIPARGVDQAGFFVLNMVFTPSVLIETGFISNSKEEKLLKSKKYQKKVASAIYNALKRFKAKYEGK